MTPEVAEDLHKRAASLGQGHSIYSTGQAHEMRFHHGAYAGRSHYGEGTSSYGQEPEDSYHSLPGGSTHFDHHFDYRSHHMSGQLNTRGGNGRG